MVNKTICNSKTRICDNSNKNFASVNSAVASNSKPDETARGPGFIPRRYLTAGGTLAKPDSGQNHNVSAAPNPIKHWRKQLIPVSNSGTGKASVNQIMDRPGGSNYITTDKPNNIKCIKPYITPNTTSICNTICNTRSNTRSNTRCRSRIKNATYFSEDYHSSTTSYLQSRVKTYDQRIATQQIPKNNYKTPPTNSSIGSQEYHSQYTKDKSGCSLVSIIYKPSNNKFLKEGAVSSNLYTMNLRQKAENICVLRNTWGLNNVCSAKYTDYNFINKSFSCNSKTTNISKRYSSGGVGNHTVCHYRPTQKHIHRYRPRPTPTPRHTHPSILDDLYRIMQSLELKCDLSVITQSLDIKSALAVIMQSLELKCDLSVITQSLDIKSALSVIMESLDIKSALSVIMESLDIKSALSVIMESLDMKGDLSVIMESLDIKSALAIIRNSTI